MAHLKVFPLVVLILDQINPIHVLPSCFFKNLFLWSYHLRLCLLSGLLPSSISKKKTLYAIFLFPICAARPAHLILPDMNTRKILGEGYRSLSSSLCSLIHSPVTSSILGPSILLSTLFPQHPQPIFLPQYNLPIYNHKKQQAKS